MNLIIALAFLVGGVVLLLFGLNASDSVADSLSRIVSGHLTDRTLWMIVGGAVCFTIGLAGCFFRRRA